jgi:hypothetical protein
VREIRRLYLIASLVGSEGGRMADDGIELGEWGSFVRRKRKR